MSEKLQKVLARLGLGSRRELDAMIAAGRIEVNGRTAKVGDRVEGTLTVKIDGRVVATPTTQRPKCRVLMYYKPEGELTTIRDPEDRPTVFDHLPRPDFGRWIYVGRLDLNTSGLLLFTTDGELANALMHPKGGIERIYAVRVFGEVTDAQLTALQQGVELDDGPARFERVTFAGGEGRNTWYHVTLKEGRNREVRRLWESVGVQVSRLIRVKYANLELDPSMHAGEYRELTLSEINNLRAAAGLKPLKDSEAPKAPLEVLAKRDKRLQPKAPAVRGGRVPRGRQSPQGADRFERTGRDGRRPQAPGLQRRAAARFDERVTAGGRPEPVRERCTEDPQGSGAYRVKRFAQPQQESFNRTWSSPEERALKPRVPRAQVVRRDSSGAYQVRELTWGQGAGAKSVRTSRGGSSEERRGPRFSHAPGGVKVKSYSNGRVSSESFLKRGRSFRGER